MPQNEDEHELISMKRGVLQPPAKQARLRTACNQCHAVKVGFKNSRVENDYQLTLSLTRFVVAAKRQDAAGVDPLIWHANTLCPWSVGLPRGTNEAGWTPF